MSLTKLIEWVCAIVLALWGLTAFGGCGIINTGPTVATAAVEAATGTARVLAAQFQPEQMRAGVEFDIHDPRYFTKVFVGTGVLCTIDMGLNGVDTSVDISGSGKGVQIPLDVKTKLIAIMGNAALSEEQRKTMFAEAIANWLKPKPVKDKPNVDPAAEEDPNARPTRWGPPSKPTESARPGRVARAMVWPDTGVPMLDIAMLVMQAEGDLDLIPVSTQRVAPFDPNEIRRVETVKAGKVTEVAWFRGDTQIAAPQ